MRTRKEYINKEVSHDDYYAQFVTERVIAKVSYWIGINQIIKAYQTDPHFNNIPLSQWDAVLVPQEVADLLEEAGDYLTLAGQVCINKRAARMIAEKRLDKEQG